MLKVRFTIEFDKEGRIENLSRSCEIPRMTCKGCKFEKWCNKVEKKS